MIRKVNHFLRQEVETTEKARMEEKQPREVEEVKNIPNNPMCRLLITTPVSSKIESTPRKEEAVRLIPAI